MEFLDATDLPMSAQAVRRALTVLVEAGRLKRRRHRQYGNNYYMYQLVDAPHLEAYEHPDALPTESYETHDEDDMPTEHYENLPPMTANREAKDRENGRLKLFAEHVEKVKAERKGAPTSSRGRGEVKPARKPDPNHPFSQPKYIKGPSENAE